MTMTLISVADLATHLGAADVRVFDVRHDLTNHAAGREAYAAGHIPGARYLDHETELAAARNGKNGRHPLPDRGQFGALMAAHGVTPETLVVAYDASGGMYAAHLWWMLRWLGHDRVAVLDGGWQAWQAVLDNIARPGFTVIDARAANRYRGEVEPMDPVAGHIPGALTRPNGQNLQADGRFKDAAQLRQEFTALLDGRDPAAIVHQCGSGITACHNLLSMEIAGLAGSRLYPGSWSEWCSDPSRPVAKGE